MNRDWMDRALCAQVDPELFFPDQGQGASRARMVCLGCPVRVECADYADRLHMEYGVWAGMTPRERLRDRKRVA